LSRRLELSPASATEVPRCTAIRLEMIDLLRFTGVASMGNMGESIAVPGHIGARRVGRQLARARIRRRTISLGKKVAQSSGRD
jgi:hypothetical protein